MALALNGNTEIYAGAKFARTKEIAVLIGSRREEIADSGPPMEKPGNPFDDIMSLDDGAEEFDPMDIAAPIEVD